MGKCICLKDKQYNFYNAIDVERTLFFEIECNTCYLDTSTQGKADYIYWIGLIDSLHVSIYKKINKYIHFCTSNNNFMRYKVQEKKSKK